MIGLRCFPNGFKYEFSLLGWLPAQWFWTFGWLVQGLFLPLHQCLIFSSLLSLLTCWLSHFLLWWLGLGNMIWPWLHHFLMLRSVNIVYLLFFQISPMVMNLLPCLIPMHKVWSILGLIRIPELWLSLKTLLFVLFLLKFGKIRHHLSRTFWILPQR